LYHITQRYIYSPRNDVSQIQTLTSLYVLTYLCELLIKELTLCDSTRNTAYCFPGIMDWLTSQL